MLGGKLRFALSGIWANHRNRGGGRGVGRMLQATGGSPEERAREPGVRAGLGSARQPRCQPGGSQPGLPFGPLLRLPEWPQPPPERKLHVLRHQPGG